ncbi:MAG: ribonuclease H-like domain-containing protein [Candidatus Altiarchaeota archaeon]|nr:ribonuclease H-like domain-containing protein [Candidatus Altiarchaeota archaeon]
MKTLLDADYTTQNEKAVVRLFYKTESGREIEEISDFKPYIYVLPREHGLERLKKRIEKLNSVEKLETVQMRDTDHEIEVLKVTLDHPKNVPDLRPQIKELEECKEVREAHIPFAERYIIDAGLVPMDGCEALDLRIASFDMEVYNPRGEPKADIDPIIIISYADNHGLDKVFTYKTVEGLDLDYLDVLKNEEDIIKKFIETIKERGIDIIVTYNGDNFDFPYLKERAEKHKIPLSLGVDDSPVKMEKRGMNLGARVRGRPHIDMYPVCRQIFNLSKYTLEDVYLEITGGEKKDIRVGEMAGIWDNPTTEKFKELLEYAMSDASSTLEIALDILPLHYEISRITKELIYQSSRSGSGQRVESLLIKKAFEKKILVPNKPSDRVVDERQRTTYAGGYVVEPKKGIHDNILLFDFRSLYPSIIISHNIDPSTLDCECCPEDPYRSPTGHYFCKKKVGLIPETLEGLVQRRIDVKKRLREEKDPKRGRFLEVEQQALKVLANSMYGYFGFPRARWYSKECAESIAALGRKYIHQTIETVPNFGFEVIYGDTDSVYMIDKSESKRKDILKHSKSFLDRINSELPEAMELEFEGFYPRGIFITKKRYALIDEKDMLIVKGLETRRRDWANIAKYTQEKVLNALLKDKDPNKAAKIVKDVVQEIKKGKMPLEELTINTQITRGMGEYKTEGPHIQAAKKAIKKGLEFKQGSIVTYVITKKGASISDKAQVIDFVEEGDYDADYYVNNQVLPAVLRLLEALGYSEDELKGLGRQTTLS